MMIESARHNLSTPETWRLFIAVPLRSAAREIMHDVESQLKAYDWPVKWVDPDLAHITVKFLGDTRSDLVPAVERELGDVVAHSHASEALVSGAGAFPSTKKPRVIWLGLGGDMTPLEALARDVDRAMTSIDFAPEDRPFRPHITMGRVRQGKVVPDTFATVIDTLRTPGCVVPLDRVRLVRSVLGPAGATYITLSEWRLGTSHSDEIGDAVELVEHG